MLVAGKFNVVDWLEFILHELDSLVRLVVADQVLLLAGAGGGLGCVQQLRPPLHARHAGDGATAAAGPAEGTEESDSARAR